MADEGVRKHCVVVPGTTSHFTCKYCGLTTRGGGITRMKLHLSGNDPKKNVKRCDKCPPEVREEMRQLLHEAEMKKKNKSMMKETIRQELRANLDPRLDHREDEDLYEAMKRSRHEANAATWRSGPGGGSGSQQDIRSSTPISPSLYRDARGLFGRKTAVSNRDHMAAGT